MKVFEKNLGSKSYKLICSFDKHRISILPNLIIIYSRYLGHFSCTFECLFFICTLVITNYNSEFFNP